MKTVVSTLMLFAAFGLSAQTLALYDFSEGKSGDNVATVQNQIDAAAYEGTAGWYDGFPVTYSDDVPGLYLFPDQSRYGTPLSQNWKSVVFTADAVGTYGHGGYINFPGLGNKVCDLGANGAFTIECFVKVSTHLAWRDLFKFFYRGYTTDKGSLDNQQAKFVDWDSKFAFQVDGVNPTKSSAVPVDEWHHVAVVYQGPATSGDVGSFTMYLDGESFATREVRIDGQPTNANRGYFRIGGDGNEYENFCGKIAGFRISDTALTSAQFLKAGAYKKEKQDELDGALGLWTFAEGTVGEPVVGAGNAIDASDTLVGAAVSGGGTSGIRPVYAAEVPGVRILSSLSNQTVIAENLRSVKFSATSTRYADAGRLTMKDIRTRITDSAAFTLEYFVKYDENLSWRNTFAMCPTSLSWLKVCNRTDLTGYGVQYNAGGGASTVEKYAWNMSPNLSETWHHTALSWDAESSELLIYVDYKKVDTVSGVTFDATACDGYFGCAASGTSDQAYNGKIACIRLMPRKLAPEEMMVVGRGRGDAKTIFHWTFEDDQAVAGNQLGRVQAQPVDAPIFQGVASQSYSELPKYSSAVSRPAKSYVFQGKEILATNSLCAYFFGCSTDHPNSWAGSHLETDTTQANRLLRTPDFTCELFIRRDLNGRTDGSNGQLIGGFGGQGINTTVANTDWSVCVLENQNQELNFRYVNKAGSTKGVKLGFNLEDGEWHHLAFTYDDASQTLTAYLDYQQKFSETLTGGMRCTTDSSWTYSFGRGYNSSGFNGWMDDIRVSDGVRPVDEFLKKGNLPSGLTLIFR